MLALAITGCAENAVRLDHAHAVSEKADLTSRQLRDYYADVEARRRETAAIVVASEPSCPPAARLRVQMPRQEAAAGTPLAPFCYGREGPRLGYDTYLLDLGPTPQTAREARAALVTAVVDYGVALAKIVADPNADVEGELARFAERADRVGSFVGLVAGKDVPSLGDAIDSGKGKAIRDLAVFAEKLAHEARQVADVRAIVAAEGVNVDNALALILTDIEVRRPNETASLQLDQAAALRNAYLRERERMSFSERRQLMRMILDTEADGAVQAQQEAALARAVQETQEAQLALRQALLDSRHWSKEMRDKAAAENLDRLTRALGLIAGLGRAFI
ncbi:hypothetical protein [Sphingomonas profundi]|uniref:hypothetical protein n=1 Tax=Alterirhizorhabdus profundi TaxID=2681549 RepID=UPI0012E81E63|nr:hypothetical protein [Sphingomonas profundi]